MHFVKDIGTELYIAGFILAGNDEIPIAVLFPNTEIVPGVKPIGFHETEFMAFGPTLKEYETIIRQIDIHEVEITQNDGSKAIVRMSQRALDNAITWKCFERDEYKCRYCGQTGIPLTYDHVYLWEKGGENTIENGVTACRKCNKQRGNMDYKDWLESDIYHRKISNVEEKFVSMNLTLLPVYQSFKKRDSNRQR